MARPELGTKRICPSCSARFYDLEKRPIECPKCHFTFEPEA
ncbi:MAG: TIGR02300 family protein, partial [Desulfuromonadales bacterium]|nr:TIGR02300 family protein [Desulfuromonadales bacterium]NIS43495.1 TIGR02300 family protein [Desulfuromonadales bacterium]